MSFKKGHKINLGRKRTDLIKMICLRGHDISICGRSGSQCSVCKKESYLNNIEQIKEYDKKYYQLNIEKRKKQKRKWQLENRDFIYKYRRDHPEIYKIAYLKQEQGRNLRIVQFGQVNIVDFYINCPKNKEVDHIIPLQGKKVSGLHVSWNLQYLTRSQNAKKHNKVNLKEASKWYGKILKETGLK